MLTTEYLFLDICRREDSKDCVASSYHQSYKVDQPKSFIQSHPKVVIANSKRYNRQFEDLENGPRDDKVHRKCVGRALEQIVLIDPVMNTGNDNDGRHADRVDIRVEKKSEQLNEVETVSICEVELRQLTNLIILHLKQRIMIEKPISKLPPISLNLAIDLEEVQRNGDKPRNDHQVGYLHDKPIIQQITLSLPQTQQEEHNCSVEEHSCEHLDDERYEVFGLCLVLLLVSHVLYYHSEQVVHPVHQERYCYCSAVGDAFVQNVVA